jgi:hypothetical protein
MQYLRQFESLYGTIKPPFNNRNVKTHLLESAAYLVAARHEWKRCPYTTPSDLNEVLQECIPLIDALSYTRKALPEEYEVVVCQLEEFWKSLVQYPKLRWQSIHIEIPKDKVVYCQTPELFLEYAGLHGGFALVEFLLKNGSSVYPYFMGSFVRPNAFDAMKRVYELYEWPQRALRFALMEALIEGYEDSAIYLMENGAQLDRAVLILKTFGRLDRVYEKAKELNYV